MCIRDRLENVKIVSFEIGNEVDLYATTAHMRTPPWNGKIYTEHFLKLAEVIYQEVLEPVGIGPTFFEPPSTASTLGNDFSVNNLVEYGLTKEYDGNFYVKMWNQHDYLYCT